MREEIELHLRRAEQKLEAARYLCDGGYYNDAVSRTYYCMFHAASALLLTKDIAPRSHRELVRQFGLEFVKPETVDKWYAKALRNQKDMRELGDYDVTREMSQEETEQLIENAKEFLNEIRGVIEDLISEGKE
ncbi:MAG: HEPN domain-containing protein [Thermoplasmata archaeon]